MDLRTFVCFRVCVLQEYKSSQVDVKSVHVLGTLYKIVEEAAYVGKEHRKTLNLFTIHLVNRGDYTLIQLIK